MALSKLDYMACFHTEHLGSLALPLRTEGELDLTKWNSKWKDGCINVIQNEGHKKANLI